MNGSVHSQPTRRTGESFEVDHAYIRQMLKWLGGAEDEEALAVLLADFDEYLRKHFASEERNGGLFASVVAHAPRRQHAVEALRREHDELLEDVAALQRELAEPEGKASEALRRRVRAFVAKLSRHEQREDGLLQDALQRELRGQD